MPGDMVAKFMATRPPQDSFLSALIGPGVADVIDVYFVGGPTAPWPKAVECPRRPTVVVIGDDPGTPNGFGGPDAWRCVNRLRRWVRATMVHGAGGEREHYAEAVRAALKVGRVAIIECTSGHAKAWRERINCDRTLLLIPRDGLVHPLEQAGASQ